MTASIPHRAAHQKDGCPDFIRVMEKSSYIIIRLLEPHLEPTRERDEKLLS
jgi:hypothetical protein